MRTAASAGATVHGTVAAGYEAVAEAFARNFAEHGEVGAAFAAVVGDEPVVDLWGGTADRRSGAAWTQDTLVGIFSGSKGLVATCMLLLLERGALRLGAPLAAYWPEFAAEGKQGVLVRHLLSHRTGVPGLLRPVDAEEATDDVRMAALVAAQAPITRPGAWHCYHALTFGWMCGELVRRVDGRSLGRFLQEEVAQPLGLDCWIGLPPQLEPRVARVERDDDAHAAGAEEQTAPPGSIAWAVWDNPPRFLAGELAANAPAWHAAEVPGSNAIVSARSLARLYACLAAGGSIDGVRLLSPETLEQGRRLLGRGYDPYLDGPTAFASGFQLQTDLMLFGPEPSAFGHSGAGGSTHGAWPELATGFSYVMNRLGTLGAADPRAQPLLAALHEAVAARRSRV